MGRKIMLTCIALFIAAGSMKQILFCLMLGSIFLAVHIKTQPFDDDNDDNLTGAGHIATVATLIGAGLLKSGEDGPDVIGMIMLVNLVVMLIGLYNL